MGVPEYLLGLLAIITGLAISTMVTSLHGLLRRARQVRWGILPVCAALVVFQSITYSWWLTWTPEWQGTQFWFFQIILFELIGIFLAAKAVLPDDNGNDEPVDLHEHYWKSNRYVWLSLTFTNVLFPLPFLIQGANPLGSPHEMTWFATRLAYISLGVALAFIQRPWFHRIAVPSTLLVNTFIFAGQALQGTV